jgi:hypothetical protein
MPFQKCTTSPPNRSLTLGFVPQSAEFFLRALPRPDGEARILPLPLSSFWSSLRLSLRSLRLCGEFVFLFGPGLVGLGSGCLKG